ncbi:SPFH domain-containing protein [Helicobacter bizzozeronii]|uniref:SPFH domain-containing protein n=1 Tax=Helicobacter bizzozeronii TaxID=56877 RepID=UPI0039891424
MKCVSTSLETQETQEQAPTPSPTAPSQRASHKFSHADLAKLLTLPNDQLIEFLKDKTPKEIATIQTSLEDLPIKRNEIAALINTDINKEVSKLPNSPVELSSIQLREIVLPAKIKEQIEKVQIARQESERVKYEVERAKQEAQKAAALAKGEADANRIRAQGVADAIVIEAKAKSAANLSIGQSLNERLLQLRQIETQGQFNEALKTNKNAQIFLVPGGAVPNIWLDTKSKPKSLAGHAEGK